MLEEPTRVKLTIQYRRCEVSLVFGPCSCVSELVPQAVGCSVVVRETYLLVQLGVYMGPGVSTSPAASPSLSAVPASQLGFQSVGE